MSGESELAPWAVAASAALLGGAAGLLPLVAVEALVPGPDPRAHKDAPLDHGDVTGQAFLMLVLALATALPALGLVAALDALDAGRLAWLGVPAGLLTGAAAYVWLGRRAALSLARRGPELLHLMRSGREEQASAGAAAVIEAMPPARRRLLWGALLAGCLALFPQTLVPAAMKLSGSRGFLLLAPTGTQTLATAFWSASESIDYAGAAPYAAALVLVSAPLTYLLLRRPDEEPAL